MIALNTDLEIWPTPLLIFTVGVIKCKIWPLKRCGFEKKQRVAYLFKFRSVYGGPLTSPNLPIWYISVSSAERT